MEQQRLIAKQRLRRQRSTRNRVRGTSERPRLTVYRSNLHIYAQVIDDSKGETIASASTCGKGSGIAYGGNVAAAKLIGKQVAERAMSKGVTKVAFDRGYYKYHGRIKALADAAREAGLKF